MNSNVLTPILNVKWFMKLASQSAYVLWARLVTQTLIVVKYFFVIENVIKLFKDQIQISN